MPIHHIFSINTHFLFCEPQFPHLKTRILTSQNCRPYIHLQLMLVNACCVPRHLIHMPFSSITPGKVALLILQRGTQAQGLPGGKVVKKKKNHPANAGDARDTGSIPGFGRSPGGGNGNHSSIPARKIPWTEEPGGLQSTGLQRVGRD